MLTGRDRKMVSTILDGASSKIARFNALGLHYNIASAKIYEVRLGAKDPFDRDFQQYIIAGLIAFDMQRMMGESQFVYRYEEGCFALRLEAALRETRQSLEPLLESSILATSLSEQGSTIRAIYERLATNGGLSLDNRGHRFDVGATKVLHFLNPNLFAIVDSNARRAYAPAQRTHFGDPKGGVLPSEWYVECMRCAQLDILNYGADRFQALEPGTPLTRIYDMLTFITGRDMSKRYDQSGTNSVAYAESMKVLLPNSQYIQALMNPEWASALTEAVDGLKSTMSTDDLAELRDTPKGSQIMFHFGPGIYIRNEFGLWQGNDDQHE